MNNLIYSLQIKKLPKVIVDTLTLEKLNKLNCLGIKELDIEEEVVDKILGDKSYCGGEISEEILAIVDDYIDANQEYEFFLKEKLQNKDLFIDNLFNGFEQLLETFLNEGSLIEKETEPSDWNEEWKKNYKPLKITENFFVVPAFYKGQKEDEEITTKKIYINPGLGFGTGTHPTTSLCLKYMDESLSTLNNRDVIDYGCGSGILGLYFLKYSKNMNVDLYDIDKDALENAKDNLFLNNLNQKNQYHIYSNKNQLKNKKYDVILANILLPVLKEELPTFENILNPKGKIILSGILNEQVEELLQSYKNLIIKNSFKVTCFSQEDWSCVILDAQD